MSQQEENNDFESQTQTIEDNQVEPENTGSEAQDEAQESNEVKTRAKKFGHLSKEEFLAKGGREEDYKDEKEFVKFGEDYSTVKPVLDSLKKQLDRKEKEIEAILEYNKRTAEREYQRAKSELDFSLSQAKQQGDIDRVEVLSQEKARMDIQKQGEMNHQRAAAQQEAVDEFLDRNKHWFNTDHPELKDEAIRIDEEVRQDYPNITYKELGKKIENRMRDLHPDIVGRGTVNRPVMNQSKSNMAKSSVDNNSNDDIKLFKKLCAENKNYKYMFDAQKRLLEKGFTDLKGKTIKPKYTEKDFINQLRKDGEI